jgi:hypothetical protein
MVNIYNLANLTNVTDLGGLFVSMNGASNSALSIGLIISFEVILFVNFLRYGFTSALAVSGFLSSLVASLLYLTGALPFQILIIIWLITAFAGFMKLKENAE